MINYDVPLPGFQSGRRFVRMNLGLSDQDFTQAAIDAGEDIAKVISLESRPGGATYTFDPVAAAELFRRKLYESGATAAELAALDEAVTVLREGAADGSIASGRDARRAIWQVTAQQVLARTAAAGAPTAAVLGDSRQVLRIGVRPPVPPIDGGAAGPGTLPPAPAPHPGPGTSPQPQPPPLIPELRDLFAALETGVFLLPRKSWTGQTELVSVRAADAPIPTLFLIEVHAISSLPGNFGLGRTVRTFTLFPGESSDITIRNWRTARQQESQASSIVDSYSQEAADRFNSQLNNEQSDSVLDDTVEKFSWDAHGGGGIDFGFFSVGGGGGASDTTETHASRQQFAKQVSNTLIEHTNQANDSRQITVSSTAESVAETGDEALTVRTVRNVNMRRTLNFVFRELNQEFRTRVHLVELRVGFDNGRLGSWQEASLSGLRPFLRSLIADGNLVPVMQQILKLASVAFDHQDQPVPVLETLGFSQDGQTMNVSPAAIDQNSGEYPPPDDTFVYRFKGGPLGQQDGNPVDGVVLGDETVALRTDSLIAEALLGQVDALDSYALEKQATDAKASELENKRNELVQRALDGIQDPKERADAYAEIYRPLEELELNLNRPGSNGGL
ncbi:hypothetical protein [Streptomyces sp. NPDC048191]|uniref:hypothetical protein n=1 Tax=Streptomyces sp. NPDC048191 TaxID=3155484 RepID=UPI0033CD236E